MLLDGIKMKVWIDNDGDVVWRSNDQVGFLEDEWDEFLLDGVRTSRRIVDVPGSWMVLK